ncbi:D-alanyl-D-alanine carboxypeptidase family protein [Sulfuritalea hydrogenivorans]|jgi:D-alanyl-D-alanine carboxypeptidase (penicillin-binding protein 5/6)|uniref:serine-type D-Ala-D-Ala carboxypeptidase n=1 Tax=Sulfuritalea hydrogenivorans sk43H TaxID=1223802 RepID=W0SAM4_9PROT|nr:D-alanyl-D-alanine carboxypeptidase family protein [Sulfuritalea hydrogenivorans]BAO28056.1 D-alanyl-D-alanine carboxypeptidase [Sulfuritalea hydrogenivorans sk43H]
MRFFALILAVLSVAASHAQPIPVPTLSARAWVLMDYATGQVLAAQEPDTRLEPASLTKVMTTYLVADALAQKTLSLQQPVTVSERAWRTQGSRSFVPVNKGVLVDDLFKGMVIQSGNDASVALAEAIGGTEDAFAAMMNRTAQRMGLKDTHFLNASGYFEGPAPNHYSTARDLARLAAALMRDHPETHALHATKEYTYNGIRQHNRNRLLWADPTVDGLKTGHSSAAGFCLIATAKRGPRRLISVVLGTASEDARARDSLNLLNWGFTGFDAVKLYDKGQAISQLKVFKGAQNIVKAGFAEDFVVSVPRGSADKLSVQLVSHQPLIAPVAAGAVIGTLKLAVAGQAWGEYPVVAQEAVPVAGFLGRLWDDIRLFFQ